LRFFDFIFSPISAQIPTV